MRLRNWIPISLIMTLLGCWVLQGLPVWGASEAQAPASIENMAFPLPDKPSFAVLPFDNLSSDPELEFLSDGVTEALILSLYKVPGVFVIAPTSIFTYKGRSTTIKEVAEELGVQYIIQGSVKRSGDQLGITVQMIDALKGDQVWSEGYDRSMEDMFNILDEIILNIAKSVGAEYQKLGPKLAGTNKLDAYLKFLEGTKFLEMETKDGLLKAKPLFEEAVAIDPNFSGAHDSLSAVYITLARFYGSGESRKEDFEKGLELAEKAIELDNSNDWAYLALGYYHQIQKGYDTAVSHFQKTIELNPLNSEAHSNIGACLHWSDRAKESVHYFKEAIRVDPMAAGNYVRLGRVHYHLKQYEDAIRMHEKCLELAQKGLGPEWWSHLHLAMVYGELGRDEEARAHMKKLLEKWPNFNLEARRRSLHFKDPAINEREIAALRKAGAPEHPPSK